MDFDEFWFESSSADDIYKELKKEEEEKEIVSGQRPSRDMQQYRGALIDWMIKNSKNLRNAKGTREFALQSTTVHLAIRLLDLYLDHHDAPLTHYFLATITCLILAAKFEEKETHIPKLKVVNELLAELEFSVSKEDFSSLEREILEFLDWGLFIPTPAHFIPYFLSVSDVEEDPGFPQSQGPEDEDTTPLRSPQRDHAQNPSSFTSMDTR